MSLLFVNSGTPNGNLRLNLVNLDGYPQDAVNVKWSVYKSDGSLISGFKQSATKVDTGIYQAPWNCSSVGGCYQIRWEYQLEYGQNIETYCSPFFVISPSYYQDFCAHRESGVSLSSACKAFFCGQSLSYDDLSLFLKDENGILTDAFLVRWTILDSCCCPVTETKDASPGLTAGSYYANYYVNLRGGEYQIKWEYMKDAYSPLESASMNFSVVCNDLFISTCSVTQPSVNVQSIIPEGCIESECVIPIRNVRPCTFPSSVIPMTPIIRDCCSFEIPRVVHLLEQILPVSGVFTNQSAYQIPTRIRKVTFYISYKRGMAGGYGLFRLMWGNGIEETQSTMIDLDFNSTNTSLSQQDMYLNDLKGPQPLNDNFVNFTIETRVPGGATTVRLLASEGGQTSNPGVIRITLTAASD